MCSAATVTPLAEGGPMAGAVLPTLTVDGGEGGG